jgi:hypothetical protein
VSFPTVPGGCGFSRKDPRCDRWLGRGLGASGRQVEPAAGPIDREILPEVGVLESDTQIIAAGSDLLLISPRHGEDQATDGCGGVIGITAQLGPVGKPIALDVPAKRGDQVAKMLLGEPAGSPGGGECAEDALGSGRWFAVQPRLPAIESGEAGSGFGRDALGTDPGVGLVGDIVGAPGECIDGGQVGPGAAWQQTACDGEVLVVAGDPQTVGVLGLQCGVGWGRPPAGPAAWFHSLGLCPLSGVVPFIHQLGHFASGVRRQGPALTRSGGLRELFLSGTVSGRAAPGKLPSKPRPGASGGQSGRSRRHGFGTRESRKTDARWWDTASRPGRIPLPNGLRPCQNGVVAVALHGQTATDGVICGYGLARRLGGRFSPGGRG